MPVPARRTSVPPLAERLLRVFAGRRHASFVGDLAEEYDTRIRQGEPWTTAWYWGEVFGATPGFLWGRLRGDGPGSDGAGRWQDLRYAFRALRKRPVMTLIAVLTIGVGIGVNVAVFTVVDGVILRPLPFDDPGHLGLVWGRDEGPGAERVPIHVADLDRVAQVPGIVAAVAFGTVGVVVLHESGEPERVDGAWSTGDLVGLLGVDLLLGRSFDPHELRTGAPLLLISHRLWRSRFGEDSAIVGRSVRTRDGARTIVGVTPPGFAFPDEADVWMPPPPWVRDPGSGPGTTAAVLVRTASDIHLAAVAERLAPVTLTGRGSYQTDHARLRPWVEPLQDHVVGQARTPLLLLLSASGALLLLACANVSHLLLASGMARESEWALRTALGAGRRRILAQVLGEGALVALTGGAVGMVLAWGVFQALPILVPPGLPRIDEIAVDGRVMVVMLLVTIVAGFVSASLPAMRAARAAPMRALRTSGTGCTPTNHHRLQSVLIAGEVALGTILVVGASLLLVTLRNLRAVDTGFRTDVMSVRVMNLLWDAELVDGREPDPGQGWTDILERVAGLPGVVAAATAALHPMERGFVVDLDIPGLELGPEGQAPSAMFFPVSARYPETVGIPLLRGRPFDAGDHGGAAGVALVNEEFVRRYLGDADPIGRRVRKRRVGGPWGPAARVEIVGVVGDVKSRGLAAEPEPIMFVPQAQAAFGYLRLFVRATGDAVALIPAIREIVWSVDPRVPLPEFAMLEDAVQRSIATEVFLARLVGIFSVLGVLLAMGGVYGIVSFAMSRRTREIGIRRALGADARSVAGMVARWSLARVGAGIALGLIGALGLDRVLGGIVYGVDSGDPRILIGVTLALTLAGALATAVPLRRVLTVDPLTAVRAE